MMSSPCLPTRQIANARSPPSRGESASPVRPEPGASPRWPGRGRVPGIAHVRDLDLHAATDAEVLRVAAERDLVIVTKDKDFADIVTARGGGPKVLWLMLGNASTDASRPTAMPRARPHPARARRGAVSRPAR